MQHERQRDDRTVILQDEGLRKLRGFTQLPNVVLRHPTLSFGAKVAYAALLSYAWQDLFCHPAQERLAQDLACSDRHVRNLLRELRAAGAVDWEQRGLNKPNVYLLRPLRTWIQDIGSQADRNDSSGPDRNVIAAQDRNERSAKEYSRKNTQTVNVQSTFPRDDDLERSEALVADILEVTQDAHSTGFYRLVARTVPSDLVYQALAETKDIAHRGLIRRSRGACFTDAVVRLAAEHGVDIGHQEPRRHAA